MRLTIFTAGSRGDVQPCVALGRGLQDAGYEIVLAAPENFAQFVEGNGLRFHPLRGDVQEIMASKTGRELMETGSANPLKSMRTMRTLLGPVALQMAADALAACKHSAALISLAAFAPFGKSIAEICNLPLIAVEPTPLLPTRSFPAAGWPLQRNLGSIHNRLSGYAMLYVIWQWYRPYVNIFRREHGLPPMGARSFFNILATTPLLGAYSSTVVPRPPDWPKSMNITGYWFLDSQSNWSPDTSLQEFLANGEAPVCVGFGSMAGSEAPQFTALVLDALAKSGQRGLLLTGWGGVETVAVPDDVYILESAPHDWLFPRMAAVVHHGGAGTTAEGLRAGVPTVVVPYNFDQAFWGKRVYDLGVGPKPLKRKKLYSEKLAQAIRDACTNSKMNQRADQVGDAIRQENGVARAVTIIGNYLEN